jgi:PAS domain S-box-containing protein
LDIVHLSNLKTISERVSTPFVRIVGYLTLILCALIGLSVFILYRLAKSDITNRLKAEEALRESEDKFRSFAEQSLVGIYLISDDRFKYVNPKFAEIFGYSVDECLDNMRFRQLVHPEDLATVEKQVGRRLSGETKAVRYSFRGIKKSGETIHVEIFGASMFLKGKSVATGTMLDITESKRAEKALKESEARLKKAQSVAKLGNWEYDISTGEIWGSEQAFRIYGIERTSPYLPLDRVEACIPDAPRVNQALVDLLQKNKRYDIGFEVRQEVNGQTILIHSIAELVYENGIPVKVLGVIQNITEQKKAEKERKDLEAQLQQAQKMEAIGMLAGGVAHDLNNILGGLVSYPELLLLQLPEDSPLRKSILTIQKSGEKAAAVVEDLLTLARRGVAVTEVVNLNDVIAEYLKSPEYEKLQSYHSGVHLETHLEKDVLNILGSSTHLSKTVMNLVSNAAEAMPDGGKLTVSTENRHIDRPIRGYDDVKEGDYVVFTISDTGTGISPDDMEKIFEPFYTKKKMGRSGTGLGMAVVWGTVKDHNGYIDVQSTEGKGTTFTLYFPVTRESVEERSEIFLKDYMGKGEAILVVDDVEEQRRIVSGMLKELGYSIAMVSSGEEAVEYLRTHKVALLVLDMIMDPGMDGLDTYKKILELHPEQKALIASGFSETDRIKEVQGLGAGAYIKKPFLLEKIGIAVKKELEK